VDSDSRVLDFGSGSGRFVRMWGSTAGEVWGCDLNADQIRWCQTFLSPPYRFVTTGTTPVLPFEDRTFDLVYAGSVFTHIPESADAWLMEIRRIVRPGGYFYVTISDEVLWDAVKRGEFPLLESYMHMHPAGASEHLPADFVVLGQGPGSNVFYRRDYFASFASAYFEVCSSTPEARGFQAAFVLRRPAD
jgi:SAM-dependent methyltransferase